MCKLIHWSNAFIQMSLNECAMWTHSYVVERVWFICRWMIHIALNDSYVVEWFICLPPYVNDKYAHLHWLIHMSLNECGSICRWMIHMSASLCQRQIRTPTSTHSYVVEWFICLPLYVNDKYAHLHWLIRMSLNDCVTSTYLYVVEWFICLPLYVKDKYTHLHWLHESNAQTNALI